MTHRPAPYVDLLTRSHVLGFDNRLQLGPGQQGILGLYPQCVFRPNRLYFETLGLTINTVKIGNCDQGVRGVPSSYYNERDEKDGMKGRPVKLDTAEPGHIILFELTNNNPHPVTVEGCLEGVIAVY